MSKQYLDGSLECSILFADYAIAITNGEDGSEIFASIKPFVTNCISVNGEPETSQIEVLNIMLPAYRSIIERCTQETEYQFIKNKCLSSYDDFNGEFLSSEIIGTLLDYIWIVQVGNKVVPTMFSAVVNSALSITSAPTIKRYILLTSLNVLMGVAGYRNAAIKPTISAIVAALKSLNTPEVVASSSEKMPCFLN